MLVFIIVLGFGVSLSYSTVTDEEFVGPFPSWKNLKTDYGAVGDGKADDTVAIEKGLDDLQLHKDSFALYFPSGTYRITQTAKTVSTQAQLMRNIKSLMVEN